MLAFERHNKIIDLLYKNKKVTTIELANFLGASVCTIRNDLNKLEKDGLLKRIHGGAIIPEGTIPDQSYNLRQSKNQFEKNIICEKAFEFIKDNQSIIIDASSTVIALSKLIFNSNFRLTVITNGINTALELKDNPNINVILTGGVVRPKSNALEGILGKNLISQVNVDMAFISAHGFTLEEGLTEFNIYEAELKKLLLSRTKNIIALLDSSKLENNSIYSFAKASQINILITDSKASQEIVNKYRKAGINVIVVNKQID
ncbi:DeoR/GlpR family DNA-binding transcription regulator [Thermoanaerobacterium thermosaccharolyticum]|uniref:DeoR/GlpR family DNA-binding transcription regulator n=1 Tax=Thermoanaerobacterium thermosaccharolyticum TaxID=1517 RepID=UPI003D29060D